MTGFNEFESRISIEEALVPKDKAGGWLGPGREVRAREVKKKEVGGRGVWEYFDKMRRVVEGLEEIKEWWPHTTQIQVGDTWIRASWIIESELFKNNAGFRPELAVISEWFNGADRVEVNRQTNALEIRSAAGLMLAWEEGGRVGVAVMRRLQDEMPSATVGIGIENGSISWVMMEGVNDEGQRIRNWWNLADIG